MKSNGILYRQYGEPYGIGATLHSINIEGKNFVIDCGNGFLTIDRNKTERYIPSGDFLPDQKIDLICVTHAHQDHIGNIPRLVYDHPEALVAVHEKTLEAAKVIFRDGLKRMAEEHEKSMIKGEGGIEPTYDIEDVRFFFNNPNLVVIEKNEWIEFWPYWNIGFHEAGHDVGAVSIYIESPNGHKVVFTGDTSSHYQEVAKGVLIPDEDFITDFFDSGGVILITEGTNANRSITTKEDRKKYGCIKAINKAREDVKHKLISAAEEVQARGGVLFIPTFAKQRALETAITLIEAGFKVHIDGMAKTMSRIESSNIQNLIDEGMVVFFERDFKVAQKHRWQIAKHDDPCGHEFSIVISPSGTLQGGHAVEHCKNLLPVKNNGLFFVGHIFEGSVAEEIVNLKAGEDLVIEDHKGRKNPINVRCDIQRFDMTAHDYQEALIERIVRTKASKVLVHHCPSEEDYLVFEKEVLALPNPPSEIHHASHLKSIWL